MAAAPRTEHNLQNDTWIRAIIIIVIKNCETSSSPQCLIYLPFPFEKMHFTHSVASTDAFTFYQVYAFRILLTSVIKYARAAATRQ